MYTILMLMAMSSCQDVCVHHAYLKPVAVVAACDNPDCKCGPNCQCPTCKKTVEAERERKHHKLKDQRQKRKDDRKKKREDRKKNEASDTDKTLIERLKEKHQTCPNGKCPNRDK